MIATLEHSISHFAGQKTQTSSVTLQDRRAITEAERPGTVPLLESDDVNGLLGRPHSSALSEAIPAFFVGRNKDGFWVARDADAKIGGDISVREIRFEFCQPAHLAGEMRDHFIRRKTSNSTLRTMATGFWPTLGDKSMPCRITPSGRSRSLLGQFVGQRLTERVVALPWT